MSLPRLAVRRPVSAVMGYVAVALLGVFSVLRLAVDLIPEVALPSLNVTTNYSGAGPEEVENLVTIPIEQAVSTVSGVTAMESVSREGNSRVTLRFAWGTELEAAANEVRAQLERVRQRLPDGVETPQVRRFDPSQAPIMTVGLSGDLEPPELRRLAEEELTYYLERLEGVAAVTVQGGLRREIRVILDPVRLQSRGVTPGQVAQAIRAEHFSAPGGQVQVGQAQFALRTLGELTSPDELRSIVVARRNRVPIQLGDVAEVLPVDTNEGTIVRVDGRPGVVLSVQKRSGANTVQVADAIRRSLEQIRPLYPAVQIRPLSDSSAFIRQAIRNVVRAGFYGGLLAAAVLLLFLRSIRASLIIAVAMPVAIAASFILVERAGMTLNAMSLGGLALGIGMLLDNSIVVLENIYRHREQGKDAEEAAIQGAEEMTPAIVASTLTTLAVFLPMVFVTGLTGILFRQLSLMVAFSVGSSLLVAMTLVPVLAARLLKRFREPGSAGGAGRTVHIDRRLESTLKRFEAGYAGVVARAVRRPGLVVGTAGLLFLGSLAMVPRLGQELLPTTDEGEITISLSLPRGTRLERTDAVVRQVEALVREHVPEMEALEARAGSGSRGAHTGTVNVTLAPRSERQRSTSEIIADLRARLAQIPGLTTRVRPRSSFAQRLASGGLGGGADRISLHVQGRDLDLLRQVGTNLQRAVAAVPGIVNVTLPEEENQPEFVVRVDRQRAADLGLTATDVADAVQSAVQGRVAARMEVGGREYDIRVMMVEGEAASLAQVESLPIAMGDGGYVPLLAIASLAQQQGPSVIERLNRQRTVRITASPEGRDLGGAVREIQEAVASYGLPEGVAVFFGGEYEEQQQAFRNLMAVLALAVALVYVVMASQFESLGDPLIVMFSVPFAAVGVVFTLLVTRTPLTTQALLGLIMLGGLVVNNAIVLVSYTQLLQQRGVGLEEAVVEAARTRLRPILMTTGTTVLALVPLALELGEGSELQAPLARTVIGGLLVASLVTLVLIPTLYRWAHGRRLPVAAPEEAPALVSREVAG